MSHGKLFSARTAVGCLVASWPLAMANSLLRQTTKSLTVDLGYAAYTGVFNQSTGLNVWKGIPYAQPPTGKRRWQEPQPPTMLNIANPVLADQFGPACPQSLPQVPGASAYLLPGNEDCLYVNVYAPPVSALPSPSSSYSATSGLLPVLVWIHGGGYGQGDGTQDMSGLLGANNNSLVGVSLQYRLGAFGFLASAEVQRHGRLNSGLADQRLALQWVQQHISKFGGDAARVTVAGESAGAGSVLLHAVAAGNQGLFRNIFTASPWIPTQPDFNDSVSEQHYSDFAAAARCGSTFATTNHNGTQSTTTAAAATTFDCLVAADSLTLQYASNWVSTNPPTPHSNWAFIPVTDGTYVTGPPSMLLAAGQPVHGMNALIGNNADEGVLIVPHDIHTEDDLRAWLHAYFVRLSDDEVSSILAMYPVAAAADTAITNPFSNPSLFETDGRHPPTASEISSVAAGVQQRAYNIYAETSVVCPSYWLATAVSAHANRTAFHYQFSVPFASHGADLTAYWGPATAGQGPDFVQAFREIIGRFAVYDNPSIPIVVANGLSLPKRPDDRNAPNPAADWPPWQGTAQQDHTGNSAGYRHTLLNLNQTGGKPFKTASPTGKGIVTEYGAPGQRNHFTAEDADLWEGGRGDRCTFWQQFGPRIPQ